MLYHLLLGIVLLWFAEAYLVTPVSKSTGSRSSRLHDKIIDWRDRGGVLLIDGDNVRGKTNFLVSKERLCSDLIAWIRSIEMEGRVAVCFDHGSEGEAFLLGQCGLAISFSGPQRKCDDVIARDTKWLRETLGCDVMVVTQDVLLRKRCRSSSQSIRLSKKKMKRLVREGSSAEESLKLRFVERSPTQVSFMTSPAFVELLYDKGRNLPAPPPRRLDPQRLSGEELRGVARLAGAGTAAGGRPRGGGAPPPPPPRIGAVAADDGAALAALAEKEEGFRRQIASLRRQLAEAEAEAGGGEEGRRDRAKKRKKMGAAEKLRGKLLALEERLERTVLQRRPGNGCSVERGGGGVEMTGVVGGIGFGVQTFSPIEKQSAPGDTCGDEASPDRTIQTKQKSDLELVQRWLEETGSFHRRSEQTWERVIHAERLRQSIRATPGFSLHQSGLAYIPAWVDRGDLNWNQTTVGKKLNIEDCTSLPATKLLLDPVEGGKSLMCKYVEYFNSMEA